LAQALDEEARLQEQSSEERRPGAIADLRERCKIMEQCAGIYRSGESLAGAGRLNSMNSRTVPATFVWMIAAIFQHGAIPRWNYRACSRWPKRWRHVRHGADRSRAEHTSGQTIRPRNDEKFLAHSLVRRTADGRAPGGIHACNHTRWPPAERVYGR